jgi:two-component system LytT family sensor kinase
MLNYLPIKNLIKLTWIFSLMSSILLLTYLVGASVKLPDLLLRFVQTFMFVGLTGLLNVALFIWFYKKSPQLDKKKSVLFYLSSYLGSILIWLFVRTAYSIITGQPWEGEGERVVWAYVMAILTCYVLNTMILLAQNMVILQHRKSQSEIENLQLRANASDTANLLLRQQIHPHFLFNALNTIKSLYIQDFDKGEEYLINLASFLRISISNQNTKTCLVKSELSFCMHYLKMQQIRFGTAMNYKIIISDHIAETCYLPYFSLQPLVENVLKHNTLTEQRPILITIKEDNGYITVSNNLQPRGRTEDSTGQGLSNLAERYRLLEEEPISITSDNQMFSVRIKLLER